MRLAHTLAFSIALLMAGGRSALYARPMRAEEAGCRETRHITTAVKADGHIEETHAYTVTLLTEAAVRAMHHYVLCFDGATETFEDITAYSLNGEVRTDVPCDMIEIKPLASAPRSLKQDMQVLIPFQKVTIGTMISVTYKKTKKPNFPNTYQGATSLREGCILSKGSSWTVTSEMPLDFRVHNPSGQMAWRCVESDAASERSASAAAGDSPHATHLTFVLEQDVCHGRVGEASTQWTDPMTVPAISVCSQHYMQAAGHYINTSFTPLLRSPLPTFLDEAVRQVKEQRTKDAGASASPAAPADAETLNHTCAEFERVMQAIIDNVKYMGLWSTLKGRLIPRDMAEIARTGYGDCKDNALLLAAALHTLDYKADLAFVERRNIWIPTPHLLPVLNHAIVRAETPQGQIFYLDATNPMAMAGDIFPDIAGRPCYFFHEGRVQCETTPQTGPRERVSIRTTRIQREGAAAQTITDIKKSGALAFKELLAHREQPPSRFADKLAHTNFGPGTTIWGAIAISVEPHHVFSCCLHAKEVGMFGLSNQGWVKQMQLHSLAQDNFLNIPADSVGIAYLSAPHTWVKESFFVGMKAANLDRLVCHIDTPWFKHDRTFRLSHSAEDPGFWMIETTIFCTPLLTKEDRDTPAFQELLQTLRLQGIGASLVMEDIERPEDTLASGLTTSAATFSA